MQPNSPKQHIFQRSHQGRMFLVCKDNGNLVILDIFQIECRLSFNAQVLLLSFPSWRHKCVGIYLNIIPIPSPQVENMINCLNHKETPSLKVPTDRCCWRPVTEMLGRIYTNELSTKSFKIHEPYKNYYYNFMLTTYIPHITYTHKMRFKNTFITVDNIHHVYNKMYSLNWL